MATGMMYEAEVLRWVRDKLTGLRTEQWLTKNAKVVEKDEKMRCKHCHGRVRKHDQNDPHGPQPHFEHLSTNDARHCQGGGAFRSSRQAHQMSSTPVT